MIIKDEEASKWRKYNRDLLNKELKAFLDRAYRRSKSKKSVQSKYVAVASLAGWQKKSPVQIAQEAKSGKKDVYRMLDDFVGNGFEWH